MQHLVIAALAVLGIMWKVDLGARVYVDYAMIALIAGFAFMMGAQLDAALRRWEAKPHWRRVKATAPLRLS
jgi:hypothetical protein